LLGPIDLGSVEEVDAEIDSRTHDGHAVVEACAAAKAQPAVAPTTKPGDADREAGFSEWPIFHHPLLQSVSIGRESVFAHSPIEPSESVVSSWPSWCSRNRSIVAEMPPPQ